MPASAFHHNRMIVWERNLEMYQKMILVRTLETKFWDLAKETGEINDLHLNRGEEASSIGVCAALRSDDYVFTHHRVFSSLIGKNVDLQKIVDEILGRATGLCESKSGEMHIRDPEHGFMFSFQLVATCVPVSVGGMWASRYVKKEDRVGALFIGDASSSNAQFWEGMNAAKLFKTPLLVVVTNNHRAGNILPEYYIPEGTTLNNRFWAFGIKSTNIDGTHMDEVFNKATEMIEDIRNNPRPLALICDVERLCPHKIGQGDSRSPEEIFEASKRDPIPYAEKLLGLTETQITEIKEGATRKVNEAIDKAHQAPWPEPDKVLLDNYNS